MEKHCPTCTCAIHQEERIETKVLELKSHCQELEIYVSYDGWISEQSAGTLLQRTDKTIKNWRYSDRPLPFRKISGRIQYSLREIAILMLGSYRA